MVNQKSVPGVSAAGHTVADTSLDGFGARLSFALLHLKISQSEFARRLGASPAFISDIVRGLKKPGAEFLAGIKQNFGFSIGWLLSGEGTMFGAAGINLELLRSIRLYIALARNALVERNSVALTLLALLRDGRFCAESVSATELTFLDQLNPEEGDVELAVALYNSHLWETDPATQSRNLLAAAIAHFESRQPINKLAVFAAVSSAASHHN